MYNFIIYALYEQVRVRKPAKRCLFLMPNLRTDESIEKQRKNRPKRSVLIFGSPNRIRTGVLALKGRCPRPLDDGAKTAVFI